MLYQRQVQLPFLSGDQAVSRVVDEEDVLGGRRSAQQRLCQSTLIPRILDHEAAVGSEGAVVLVSERGVQGVDATSDRRKVLQFR